jgi:tRNA-dihydrouridine synthase
MKTQRVSSLKHLFIMLFVATPCIKSFKKTSLSMSTSFFESIGSPKFISAPMVDQSNLAWRLLVRQNGADLAFSQMMHARNFMSDKNYRSDCVDWDDYTHSAGSSSSEESRKLDKPLIAQLAGDNPDVLVAAGKYIHHDVAAIDLNLGCPQKIAKKGNYGAYLLPEKGLIVKLLSAMVQGLDCPITAKIRCLGTDEMTIDLCQAIEKCGVSMITVHGRTVDSNKLFVGPVNWDVIRKVKNSVSIPVIANGGISCRSDALR